MCDWEYAFTDRAMKRGIEQGIEQGLEQGIEQGLEQGIEQGLEQGLEQGRRGMILNLLKLGDLSIEKIAAAAGISVHDVELIQSEAAQ